MGNPRETRRGFRKHYLSMWEELWILRHVPDVRAFPQQVKIPGIHVGVGTGMLLLVLTLVLGSVAIASGDGPFFGNMAIVYRVVLTWFLLMGVFLLGRRRLVQRAAMPSGKVLRTGLLSSLFWFGLAAFQGYILSLYIANPESHPRSGFDLSKHVSFVFLPTCLACWQYWRAWRIGGKLRRLEESGTAAPYSQDTASVQSV